MQKQTCEEQLKGQKSKGNENAERKMEENQTECRYHKMAIAEMKDTISSDMKEEKK